MTIRALHRDLINAFDYLQQKGLLLYSPTPRLGQTRISWHTSHEFDMLYLLASHPGIVFSREALVKRVWGDDTFVTERSVDTLIKRLRRKIEGDAADPQLIVTVWGTGYKFSDA